MLKRYGWIAALALVLDQLTKLWAQGLGDARLVLIPGVVGLRYEFDLRGVTNLPNYVFIEDVSNDDLSAILELNTPGLMVESSTVREYHTTYAAHILGSMGAMDPEDWEIYKDQGYAMDAYIGQSGFEEAFEEYLHGIDGQRYDAVSKDGTIIEQR